MKFLKILSRQPSDLLVSFVVATADEAVAFSGDPMIPCFSFASQVHPGIKVADDGTIHVGESGRGRKLIRVPLPAGAEVVDGRLVRVPGESGCVVLVHDQSGFRGGWRLREARTPEEWLQIVRRSDAHRPPLGTGALNETAGHVMGDICPACDAICLHPAERSNRARRKQCG